jgi:hypothetical protein
VSIMRSSVIAARIIFVLCFILFIYGYIIIESLLVLLDHPQRYHASQYIGHERGGYEQQGDEQPILSTKLKNISNTCNFYLKNLEHNQLSVPTQIRKRRTQNSEFSFILLRSL